MEPPEIGSDEWHDRVRSRIERAQMSVELHRAAQQHAAERGERIVRLRDAVEAALTRLRQTSPPAEAPSLTNRLPSPPSTG